MAPDKSKTVMLSTNHPRTDPGEDLFGYAAFARMLAHSAVPPCLEMVEEASSRNSVQTSNLDDAHCGR